MRVQPSAPENRLLGWNAAGELRIKIAAPPREGEANGELLSFLAKVLELGRRDLRIEAGSKSRMKTLSAPSSARRALLEIKDI